MTLYFQLKDQDRFNMKAEKKVLKQYPDAKIVASNEGLRIMSGDTFIAAEFYFPATNDEDKAWEYAAMACRTTQQFNRTHPLKVEIDFGGEEAKNMRIERRKRNGKKSKK